MTFKNRLFAGVLLAFGALQVSAQIVDGRDFGIDGFAALPGTEGTNYYLPGGTTGGAGGKVVYANTFAELQAYLQAKDPYVVLVDHDITTGIKAYVDDLTTGRLCERQDGTEGVETTYGERIRVTSNKTLIGIVNPETGEAPLFSRITFVMQCSNNVIVRNCRFTMNGAPILKSGENKIVAWRNGAQVEVGDPDCIGIQADETSAKTDFGGHIWIDHCSFFNGEAANKDRYDGLLDCKNNVQWMTFSYNHFHNHAKACLFGKGDSDIFDNCRTISFHHNFFEEIQGSRLPLQRGGYLHYCNNYLLGCEDGWDVRTKAIGYVDANYFENTKSPVRSDREGSLNIRKDAGYDCIYKGCNNLMEGYTNIDGAKINRSYPVNVTDWLPAKVSPDYKINQIDKTADVPDIARKYSGAGKIEIWKAYADEVPAADNAEFNKAISNQGVGEGVYGPDGNKMTATGITKPAGSPSAAVKTECYGLDGGRLHSLQKGITIVKTVYADGTVGIAKVLGK